MTRVLLLSNMYPSARWPIYGPFVRAHEDLLRYPDDVEITRVVITEPRKGWRTPLKYLSFLLRAWATSLVKNFDIVHIHYAHPTAMGAIIAKARGAKVVITAHGGDVNEMLAVKAPKAARKSFLRADHIIAVSRDLERKLTEALGNNCPPMTVKNMGVNLSLFNPGDARDRTEPQHPAKLLFVGQLIKRKGPDILLGALIDVEDVPWELTIAGDGPLRGELEKFVDDHRMRDRVKFLGLCEQRDLPVLYREADVFIGPSREEPLGLVFLEAAACGCPVIGTAVGGIPEILTNGESALLAYPDVPAIESAIHDAINDVDLRRKIIAGGLEAAHANTITSSVDHTLEIYRQLLGDAR